MRPTPPAVPRPVRALRVLLWLLGAIESATTALLVVLAVRQGNSTSEDDQLNALGATFMAVFPLMAAVLAGVAARQLAEPGRGRTLVVVTAAVAFLAQSGAAGTVSTAAPVVAAVGLAVAAACLVLALLPVTGRWLRQQPWEPPVPPWEPPAPPGRF